MSQQTHTQTRELSLDLLKACSMLLVVFFHNAQIQPGQFLDNVFMLLPMAAVPCFFMASGAVFFHRGLDLKKHLFRTLKFYLTVVLWKAIYLGLYCYWGAPFNGSLRLLFSYLFLFQTMEGVGTAHFWFMDAMMTVMLAAPFLYACFRQKGNTRFLPGHGELLVLLIGLLFVFNQVTATGNLLLEGICALLQKPAPDLAPLAEVSPFSFRYSNYFTYYLLGGLLMEYRNRISPKIASFSAIAGLLGLLVIQYIQTGSLLWQGTLISGGYYWISTMALSIGLFLLFNRIPVGTSRLLSWTATHVGTTTLWIFYLHIPLIYRLTPSLFEKLAPLNGWAMNLAESCLIAGIGSFAGWLFHKIRGYTR